MATATNRRIAEILIAIEQRVDSAHSLLESVHEKLDELSKVAPPNDPDNPPDDEISARFKIGGLSASISREFWEKHGDKIKIVLLGALSWSAGWLTKLLHLWMNKS